MSHETLLTFRKGEDPSQAHVRVHAGERGAAPLGPYLTGKFCEHLGSNIYNGMHAQILRNPTFAEWPFARAGVRPDGGVKFFVDEETVAVHIRRGAERLGWPAEDIERLVESRADALAHWWVRVGDRDRVRPSPDVGPYGGRAQRVAVSAAGEGLAQYVYLPLHRTRLYEWRVVARSDTISALRLSLEPAGGGPRAEAMAGLLTREGGTFTGVIEVPAQAPAEALYRFSLTATGPGQFVVGRVLLYPADHVEGADPDVIRLLKESRLPLLRWPGGNFASGYHWEDGVGPVDARPTSGNPCWGGVEPNLFGTDEFVAVGCEPMICVNVGSATPAEAARWVEYCNGAPDTPQGARRAANGHREPYAVRFWEVGNEIYGRHQIGWTTAEGYADRYREFAEAMRAADPDIHLIANGCAPLIAWQREDWNGTVLRRCGSLIRSITDHILLSGGVSASTEPLDVYADFMALALGHEPLYERLEEQMVSAGVADPRAAITELQLFARLNPPREGETARLTPDTFVHPGTMAEAVFDALIHHAAARLTPFVEMITFTGTVNHGGGLRKERERVYPNPCHHAQTMLAAFAEATPVPVELTCATERAPGVLTSAQRAGVAGEPFRTLDPLAAIAPDGALLVSLVHCGRGGPVAVTLEVEGHKPKRAALRRLAADKPWRANTLDAPDAVLPTDDELPLHDGRLTLEAPPFSVTRLRIT